MDALAIEEISAEIIPRDISCISVEEPPTVACRPSFPILLSDAAGDADAAIALITDTAQAVRSLEEQSNQAITRLRNDAKEAKEKLNKTEVHAANVETTIRQAETEIEELTTSVTLARDEIENLRALIVTKEEELAAMDRRAAAADKRAEEASAAVQRIVTAIRTELPVSPSSSWNNSGEIGFGVVELRGVLGDSVNQAADSFSDATSIPSRNVTPPTTFGN